jgi:PucR C-terminal helix-turn-helix domain/GGDEF-like domain
MHVNRESLLDHGWEVMVREVPDYFEALDPTLEQFARDATEMNLVQIAVGLADGASLSDTPKAALDEARAAAQSNVAWVPFQRCYSVALSAWWERTYREIIGWDLDEERKNEVILVVSRYLFDYFDHHLTALEKVYSSERERKTRIHERRRLALIRQLLDGAPVAEQELGYPLAGDHLAVVAWGREPERAVSQALGAVAGTALTVPGTGGALWAWISASKLGDAELRPLEAVVPPPETYLAVGQPGRQREGFRQSHREALRAFRIGAATGDPTTFYRDVQLESLALQDESFAKEFARTQLKSIAGPDDRNRVLRDTLRAYFQTGHNGASAAALLGVHERTVSYRLATIEKVLGHGITTHRDELGLALRIHALTERRRDPTPRDTSSLKDGLPTDRAGRDGGHALRPRPGSADPQPV